MQHLPIFFSVLFTIALGSGAHAQSMGGRSDDINPATPSAYANVPIIQRSERETIALVQAELNRVGCNLGTADGVVGARSRAALRAYLENASTDYQYSETLFSNAAFLDSISAETGTICNERPVQPAVRNTAPETDDGSLHCNFRRWQSEVNYLDNSRWTGHGFEVIADEAQLRIINRSYSLVKLDWMPTTVVNGPNFTTYRFTVNALPRSEVSSDFQRRLLDNEGRNFEAYARIYTNRDCEMTVTLTRGGRITAYGRLE